jgi:hypothetical protein
MASSFYNGNEYFNINECRSFNQVVSTNLVKLSAQPCSEVILVNKTGGNLSAYDGGRSADAFAFLLANNEQFTFRGLTNSDQLSAKAAGTGQIFYRTQYFSFNSARS